jgi:hypothetical protein
MDHQAISAEQVIRAARLCRPWAESARKVYLCDVAERLGKSVAEIGRELLRLHRDGQIELARADMVAAFDQEKLLRSNVDGAIFGGYQLMVLQ